MALIEKSRSDKFALISPSINLISISLICVSAKGSESVSLVISFLESLKILVTPVEDTISGSIALLGPLIIMSISLGDRFTKVSRMNPPTRYPFPSLEVIDLLIIFIKLVSSMKFKADSRFSG